MAPIIIMATVAAVCLICASTGWALSFLRENNQKGMCRLFGTGFFVFAIIFAITFANHYRQCPNCKTWIDSAYCQDCGAEVNPTVDCPGCENEFDTDAVPAYCPNCGTKVKE